MSNSQYKYAYAKTYRPGAVRNSLPMAIYRVVSGMLALALFALGVCMLVNNHVTHEFMYYVKPTPVDEFGIGVNIDTGNLENMIVTAVFVMAAFCLVVSRMAGRLMRRNAYILELEEIMDEELAGDPDPIKA